MILRLFDVLFLFYCSRLIFFRFRLSGSGGNQSVSGAFLMYLSVFAAIFEMYNLQVASSEFQV
jgi:hypothetical protein